VKTFDDLAQQMRGEFPSFRVVNKADVWWWKLLYLVSFARWWQPTMLTRVWTTIGFTVYRPHDPDSIGELSNDFVTLWHERQHMLDLLLLQRRVGRFLGSLLWFGGYAFPQVLALGAVGAFWTPWAWLCLAALAPWPAPFRVWVEKRGYAATLYAWGLQGMLIGDVAVISMVKRVFYGWTYYKMKWGGRDELIEWFLARSIRAQREALHDEHEPDSHRV
jgi:hypothetical protein